MRETNRDNQIPAATDRPKYPDHREVVRNLGQHLSEVYIAKVTGAGGAGGVVEGVPFEPAVIEAINPGGASPAWYKSVYTNDGSQVHIQSVTSGAGTTDIAVNANPPTLAEDTGPTDWDVTVPTQMAPNGETVTLVIYGSRDVNNSL